MFKRSMVAVVLGVILLVTMACTISVPAVTINTDGVRGSGKVVEETRNVSGFSRALLEGSGNLYIEQGEKESLRIQAEDNIIPLMDIAVHGDRLVFGFKNNMNVNPTQPINYYLTVKSLTAIELAGSGRVESKALETSDMGLTIGGSGDIDLTDLQAQSLKIHVFGSGNVNPTGKVQDLSVELSGSGNYNGKDLQSKTADVGVTGSGSARVNASDSLTVRIIGSGSVQYSGSPKVSQTITGSGSVNPAQ